MNDPTRLGKPASKDAAATSGESTEWLQIKWDELHIPLPDLSPPTPEELARRHEVVERTRRPWETLPPLGISIDELLRQVREEDAL